MSDSLERYLQANPIYQANVQAFALYEAEILPAVADREDFDYGWESALDFLMPLLRRWAWGSARGEAMDLAEASEALLEAWEPDPAKRTTRGPMWTS